MSDIYEPHHSRALAKLQAAGVPVTFTRPDGVESITGYAIQSVGDPAVYQALGLIEGNAPTLLFVRDVYDVLPSLLSYGIVWAGVSYLVRSVRTTAPAGPCILADVVVAR